MTLFGVFLVYIFPNSNWIRENTLQKNSKYRQVSRGVSVQLFSQFSLTRNLKVDGCQSNLYVTLKQLLFFYKFYDFFCRRHSLMNRPCYNNLFQFMQHASFQNLNRVIFTHWKHLESRVDAFWHCFPVIKQYTFHCLMKRLPFQETRALLKYCSCLIRGVIKV